VNEEDSIAKRGRRTLTAFVHLIVVGCEEACARD
jgi:hypothetical protein